MREDLQLLRGAGITAGIFAISREIDRFAAGLERVSALASSGAGGIYIAAEAARSIPIIGDLAKSFDRLGGALSGATQRQTAFQRSIESFKAYTDALEQAAKANNEFTKSVDKQVRAIRDQMTLRRLSGPAATAEQIDQDERNRLDAIEQDRIAQRARRRDTLRPAVDAQVAELFRQRNAISDAAEEYRQKIGRISQDAMWVRHEVEQLRALERQMESLTRQIENASKVLDDNAPGMREIDERSEALRLQVIQDVEDQRRMMREQSDSESADAFRQRMHELTQQEGYRLDQQYAHEDQLAERAHLEAMERIKREHEFEAYELNRTYEEERERDERQRQDAASAGPVARFAAAMEANSADAMRFMAATNTNSPESQTAKNTKRTADLINQLKAAWLASQGVVVRI
jgi:hypothetical protein